MKIIKVVAAVIQREGKILAMQRGYGELKGGWEFPGGKIEAGESAEDALFREIQEELKVQIKVGEYLDTVEYDYPAFHLSMKCYRCHIVTGTIQLSVHEDAKWLTREQLDTVDWLPADIQMVQWLHKTYEIGI